jgi:hypothetical protein
MIRRVLSFVLASTLLCGGVWGAYVLLFVAARIPLLLLAGAGFVATIGAYWLWVDFFRGMVVIGDHPESRTVRGEQTAKWNVKRGLIRVWVLFATIWLATAGGIWVAVWSDEILWFGREFVILLRPAADYSAADYEALCTTLRRQRAAGGPVDKIPLIPVAEVMVNNGVGRVVADRGHCLIVFALEEGVDLVPISYTVVGGDGSTLREIEDRFGNRRRIADNVVPRITQHAVPDAFFGASVSFYPSRWSCLSLAGGFGGLRWAFVRNSRGPKRSREIWSSEVRGGPRSIRNLMY